MFNNDSENKGTKKVCDRMLSKHMIENVSKTFLNDGYESQLLLNVCKIFSEQTFANHY